MVTLKDELSRFERRLARDGEWLAPRLAADRAASLTATARHLAASDYEPEVWGRLAGSGMTTWTRLFWGPAR